MDNVFGLKDKERIGKLIIDMQESSGMSQARFARSRKLSGADISNLKNESWKRNPQLISGEKWVRLGRLAGYQPNEQMVWRTAETSLKKYIDNQLEACRRYSFTGILVDSAGIGKTHACKEYARRNARVFYIDCSNARTRNRLIRRMASVVGVTCTGCTTDDLLEDVIYVIGAMQQPLIILDEAGDLDDRAILEIKRLYNSLEGMCGIYMVGADGLQRKMERGIANAKVGFTEMFSRFGKKFSHHTPAEAQARKKFLVQMAREILNANGITGDAAQNDIIATLTNDGGLKDMRTVRRELIKLRIKEHQKQGAA